MVNKNTLRLVAILALGVMAVSSFAVPQLAAANTNSSVAGCIAPQATSWVVDSGNNRILEFVAPFYSGMSATVVIGQPNFYTAGDGEGHHQGGVTAATLSAPTQMAMDPWGDIWVTDSGNNRVLMYAPPFTSGMNATIVLGQSTFTSGSNNGETHQDWHQLSGHQQPTASSLYWPTAIAVDSQGNVWVVDQGENRIVEYTPVSYSNGVPQYANGEAATLVIGASTLTGQTSSSWRYRLFNPTDLAFDSSGNLWIADGSNNRVLEFTPPFSSGMAPVVAIGQPTLDAVPPNNEGNSWGQGWGNQGGHNYGGGQQSVNYVNASRLNTPSSIAFDADGNLWVSDAGNNRILEFKAPFATDMLASTVLGQSGSFTGYSPNHGFGGPDNHGFSSPGQIAFDAQGNLWVADSSNDRVVVYPAPLWSGSVATMVLGQPASYQVSTGGVGQNIVDNPNGLIITAPGSNTFKLAWVRQVDPGSKSTMFVSSTPANGQLNHAFVALSAASQVFVIRTSDGTVLYRSGAYNTGSTSQYGEIPLQSYTLSGLGVPVASYNNGFNVAWVTANGRAPTSGWLFVAAVPVNQYSLPTTVNQDPSNTQAISLYNIQDPSTHQVYTINPVSLDFTSDGSYLIVGGTNGEIAAFVRSCNTGANGATVSAVTPPVSTPTCTVISGSTGSDTAYVCNNPSSTISGSQSFTLSVTNGNSSQYDIASVSLIVANGLTVPTAQAGGCTVNNGGRQDCSGWEVTAAGQNITWTAQSSGRSGNLEPNDLDRGSQATFTWTVTIPSGAASYVQGITIGWVGANHHDSFPVVDSGTGSLTVAVTR